MDRLDDFMSEETKQEEVQKSYILIQFDRPGSVIFNTQMDGVTPFQLLAVLPYLEMKAKNELLILENERRAREEQMKLHVPSPKIEVAAK